MLERYHACSAAPAPRSTPPAKQRLKRDRRAAREPRHRRSARTCWPTSSPTCCRSSEDDLAGLPDFARAAARGAAEERGLKGKHAVTLEPLERRAVPAVLRPARSARKGVPRLDRARRQWRGDRQQAGHRRDDGAARRAGALARLSKLRALQARRHDGEDAGGGDAACSTPSGRRRAARVGEERDALQELVARRGRQLPPRAVGLALLRREAAQGALTISTRARSSRTCRSTASSRRRSTPRTGCSG